MGTIPHFDCEFVRVKIDEVAQDRDLVQNHMMTNPCDGAFRIRQEYELREFGMLAGQYKNHFHFLALEHVVTPANGRPPRRILHIFQDVSITKSIALDYHQFSASDSKAFLITKLEKVGQ